MKKTLAILLSCMLIVCAICAVALSTNAEVVPASEVKVTTSAGETTLNATTTSVACTTGTATFDATTGTLTIDGTTGISKIAGSGAGLLTVKVLGTNTVDNGGNDNAVWNGGGDLAVTGTGTLNIKGGRYLLGANGDVTLDGPTINSTSSVATNVHVGAGGNDGVLTLKGNTVLTVTNTNGGHGLDLAGICPKLVVTGNAKLTVSTTGTGINIRTSKAVTTDLPKNGATVEMSEKGRIEVLNGNQAMQLIADGITTTTGFAPSFTMKDEASFKSVTSGQGIVVKGNDKGGEKAIVQILDKATIDIDVTANNGDYGQGLDVRGGSLGADVDITTTGKIKIATSSSDWGGAISFTGGGTLDVVIKNADIDLDVAPKATSAKKIPIGLAFRAKCVAVIEDVNMDIDIVHSTTTVQNGSQGIYVANGSNVTVKGDSVIDIALSGTSAHEWENRGNGIMIHGVGGDNPLTSTLTLDENADVKIKSTASTGKPTGLCFQLGSELYLKGNAKLDIDTTGFGAFGIWLWEKPVSKVTVSDNAVATLKSDKVAISNNNANASFVVDAAQKGQNSDKTVVLAAKTVAAPTNVAASDVTANSAKITWTAVAGATSYKVYSGASLLTTVNTNEAVIDTLPSTAYSITVKAVNVADAESAASAAATFTTPAGQATIVAPAAPTNVKVSSVAHTTAKVTWNAVEGATAYDVYLGNNKVATVDTTEANLSDLTAETAYKVTVKATNVAGASPASAEVSFKTAKKNGAASIEVVLANGTKVTLDSDNTSTTGATGTIVFDPIESTVTLTDVTGIQAVTGATSVDLTYVIKGTNTLETATQANVLRAYNLTVIGDGTLNVKSTLTTTTSYTILGQKSITIGGNVTLNQENAAGNAMHVARGLVANADEDSVCTFTFKDNAKIRVKTLAGNTVYGTGHKVSLIITDKADVKLECAVKSDIIHLKADTIGKNRSIAPGSYFEVSGDAKLVVPDGNCAYRGQYNIADSKIDADATIASIAAVNAVVFKGNAQVEMAAQGQVVYPCNNTAKATVNSKQSIEISDNANVKFTSKGAYVSLQLGVSGKKNENAFTFNGGKLILDGGASAKGYAVNGKTAYTFGENVVVKTGDNKDSLTEVENPASVSTSAKYILIEKVAADDNTGNTGNSGNSGNTGNTGNTGNSGSTSNPGTSDFAPVAAAVAVLATVAVAAVVVLRKRAENK